MATPKSFKVVLTGDAGVGKTSLIVRCVDNVFEEGGTTEIFETKVAIVSSAVSGETVQLYMCDTQEQQRFREMTNGYHRNASAVVFCYDPCRPETFDNLRAYHQDIFRMHIDSDTKTMLIGTKLDLKQEYRITPKTSKTLCTELDIDADLQCSAKSAEGVNAFKQKLIELLTFQEVPSQTKTSRNKRCVIC